jgi:RNA polymerase sigma-70 factor (ECF subfamily)
VTASDFPSFYAQAKDPVFRAVLLATRRPDHAEDAVADAFLRACERWETLAVHPNPTAWVMRTAMNRFISGWRIWRREQAQLPDVVSLVPDEARSLDPFLLRQLWRLPQRQRQVVALRVLADLDTRSTAEALGLAEGTVGVHLMRGLETLRLALAGTDYEEAAR